MMGLMQLLKSEYKQPAIAIFANPALQMVENGDKLAKLAGLAIATTPNRKPLLASDEVISNWWLMHFTDRDPIQVAMWPPCNHAGALESYPNAIAAEPLPSPITVEATPYDVYNNLGSEHG